MVSDDGYHLLLMLLINILLPIHNDNAQSACNRQSDKTVWLPTCVCVFVCTLSTSHGSMCSPSIFIYRFYAAAHSHTDRRRASDHEQSIHCIFALLDEMIDPTVCRCGCLCGNKLAHLHFMI